MLYPSAEELTKDHQSRYSLVIATAKVARKIAQDAEANSIILMEKPVKTAINKIAKGEIKFREKEDDYNPSFNFEHVARSSFSDSSDDGDHREDGESNEE